MNKLEPKYPVGTRVKSIETFRNGEVGYIESVQEGRSLNDFIGYTYYVKFKDGSTSSFSESNLQEAPHTARLNKKMPSEYIAEMVKNIGATSTAFTEADISKKEIFKESAAPSAIRKVRHKDVTSKHFVGWFFALEDWVDETPEQFPYSAITHSDDISVYGYFTGSNLDGLICIEELDNSYELSFFCVNPVVQHRGIGQYLLQSVINRFKDKKLTRCVYTDTSPAIYVYKKYGFKILGIDYGKGYKPQSPHYIMQRNVGVPLIA